MAGLSIVLEAQNGGVSKKTPQVISKITMMSNKHSPLKPSSSSSNSSSSFPVPPFLEQCFLCRQKLLPGKDIYMYKGDRAFCSVECRCRQISRDEEEALKNENCQFAAIKPTSASSSPSSSGSRHRTSARNRAGSFAY